MIILEMVPWKLQIYLSAIFYIWEQKFGTMISINKISRN